MAKIKLVAHIGTSLRIAFASSTSETLQTFPLSFDPSDAINALFKNLPYLRVICKNNYFPVQI
jgi:hypothetical protein